MEMPIPHVGAPAPPFELNTTHGLRRLEDYRGSWLVLFSYVSDYAPVCTTEMISFSRFWPVFVKRKCELLGFSGDTAEMHQNWIDHMKNAYGAEISFPLAEDREGTVFHRYGANEGRSTALIDPRGILRSIQFYPEPNGRCVSEIVRLLASMQAYDRFGIATPEGWPPNDDEVVPPKWLHMAENKKKRVLEAPEAEVWPPDYWFY